MTEPASKASRPGREDKQLIAGHFPRDIAKHLRRLAVEEEKTIQALLEEAVNDLFAKYDFQPVTPNVPKAAEPPTLVGAGAEVKTPSKRRPT